ncbi:glutathione S-transferase T3-like [Humulus lupulus]|uniref:glutathione S-transferase T3-like n=1 Tax=Humulus lupulus TaxID=3486 RepID=UPI002B40CC65|nr:glutathione S-transferase T3-like [Humulus lupulus]
MSSSRTDSYSLEEDMHLCHVYTDISQDPIIGRNQSRNSFWARVESEYHKNEKFSNQPRPRRSLQTRMTTIIGAVAKLRGCINQIQNKNPSGASQEDILNQAKMLLAQEKKYSRGFKFDHVWPILKHIQKFTSDDNINGPSRFQQDSPILLRQNHHLTILILRRQHPPV